MTANRKSSSFLMYNFFRGSSLETMMIKYNVRVSSTANHFFSIASLPLPLLFSLSPYPTSFFSYLYLFCLFILSLYISLLLSPVYNSDLYCPHLSFRILHVFLSRHSRFSSSECMQRMPHPY